MSGWGRARITHLPSQQEGRPRVGSHASTWAQLVKCTRVEGITLQRIHFPVLTPSRGCKQERGQGQPVDCRSFTCIGRVNEGVKARANVLATSLPAFQLRPCVWNCGGWGNIWLPPELLKPGMHCGLSLGATDLSWRQEREYTDVVPPPLQAVV